MKGLTQSGCRKRKSRRSFVSYARSLCRRYCTGTAKKPLIGVCWGFAREFLWRKPVEWACDVVKMVSCVFVMSGLNRGGFGDGIVEISTMAGSDCARGSCRFIINGSTREEPLHSGNTESLIFATPLLSHQSFPRRTSRPLLTRIISQDTIENDI